MKLVTFKNKEGQSRAGWLKDNGVVDMQLASNGALPDNMLAFIDEHEKYFSIIKEKNLEASAATHAFNEVKQLLNIQYNEAVWWRDACLLYFQTFSNMEIPKQYEQPKQTLEYYKSLKFPYAPGNGQ